MFLRPMKDTDLEIALAIQGKSYSAVAPENRDVLLAKLVLFPEGCVTAGFSAVEAYMISHPWVTGMAPTIGSVLSSLPPSPNCYFTHDIAVSPDARGRGLARALVEQAMQVSKAVGLIEIALVSVESSLPVWKALGFQDYLTDMGGISLSPEYGYGPGACYLCRGTS